MSSDLVVRTADSISTLFTGLNRSSPVDWASNYPERGYHEQRYHLAYAYKAAVEIYACRVIGGLPSGPRYLSESCISGLVDSAITHLASISPQDAPFKGLIWPAFVTGAEAQTTPQRTAVMEIFGHLWNIWRSRNVKSATEVLGSIWARDSSGSVRRSWINDSYEKGEDWLFI